MPEERLRVLDTWSVSLRKSLAQFPVISQCALTFTSSRSSLSLALPVQSRSWSIVFAFRGLYTRCGGFSFPVRVRLSLLLCGESIQCPCGFWDPVVVVECLTLVGGSLAGGFPEISSYFLVIHLTVGWMAATFGIFRVSSGTWRKNSRVAFIPGSSRTRAPPS